MTTKLEKEKIKLLEDYKKLKQQQKYQNKEELCSIIDKFTNKWGNEFFGTLIQADIDLEEDYYHDSIDNINKSITSLNEFLNKNQDLKSSTEFKLIEQIQFYILGRNKFKIKSSDLDVLSKVQQITSTNPLLKSFLQIWPTYHLESVGILSTIGDFKSALEYYDLYKKYCESKEIKEVDSNSIIRIQNLTLEVSRKMVKEGKYLESIIWLRDLILRPTPINLESKVKGNALRELGRILIRHISSNEYEKLKDDKDEVEFLPKTLREEALLCFLLYIKESESDIAINTVTLRDREVYDDLGICLGYLQEYEVLSSIYNKALEIYFEDIHIWRQLGYSFLGEKKYSKAYVVFSNCAKIDSSNPFYHLMCAKIAINYLSEPEKAIEHTRIAGKKGGIFRSRCYYILGVCYGILSHESSTRTAIKTNRVKSIQFLQRALVSDKDNPEYNYHLALQLAEVREIQKSFLHVKKSLANNSHNKDGWILLALLFSAQKDYQKCFETIKTVLAEFPNDPLLQLITAKLEEKESQDKAIRSYNKIYELLEKRINKIKEFYEGVEPKETTEKILQDEGVSRSISAGSVNSEVRRLCVILLFLSSCFRKLSRIEEAAKINRTVKDLTEKMRTYNSSDEKNDNISTDPRIRAITAEYFYQEGRLNEDTNRISDAMKSYDSSLLNDSNHTRTLLRKGILLTTQKKYMLARTHLQSSVRIDSSFYQGWYRLGRTMKLMGEEDGASDCFLAALKLAKTEPLLPFRFLRKTIK